MDKEEVPSYKATPMKRKNFSVEEINLLKRLIQKYRPYQIENKKTDSANLGEKQRIWESITNEFNSHFHFGEETSIKQLRKLWDNLKTRRKNELLREQLVKEEEGVANESKRNAYNFSLKDEVSDSLDSNTMSVDYPYSLDESAYMNGGNSSNWTLPIETVIVEDDDNNYKDNIVNEDDDVELEKRSFMMNNMSYGDDRCQCNCSRLEAELREKKLKLILREEEELYKMKKHEQELKNEIAEVQLRITKEKKTYLAKKRKLQLQLLSRQLQGEKRPPSEGTKPISNCVQDSDVDTLPTDSPVKMSNNCNDADVVEDKYRIV